MDLSRGLGDVYKRQISKFPSNYFLILPIVTMLSGKGLLFSLKSCQAL
jgi:hypothetical protein